jgi:hypothetical protein
MEVAKNLGAIAFAAGRGEGFGEISKELQVLDG